MVRELGITAESLGYLPFARAPIVRRIKKLQERIHLITLGQLLNIPVGELQTLWLAYAYTDATLDLSVFTDENFKALDELEKRLTLLEHTAQTKRWANLPRKVRAVARRR